MSDNLARIAKLGSLIDRVSKDLEEMRIVYQNLSSNLDLSEAQTQLKRSEESKAVAKLEEEEKREVFARAALEIFEGKYGPYMRGFYKPVEGEQEQCLLYTSKPTSKTSFNGWAGTDKDNQEYLLFSYRGGNTDLVRKADMARIAEGTLVEGRTAGIENFDYVIKFYAISTITDEVRSEPLRGEHHVTPVKPVVNIDELIDVADKKEKKEKVAIDYEALI